MLRKQVRLIRLATAVAAAAILLLATQAVAQAPRAMPSDYATYLGVLPRAMPSDYGAAFRQRDAGLAFRQGDYGVPRAMPTDYSPRGLGDGGAFDWADAGIGAGAALALVLLGAGAAASLRGNSKLKRA